MVSVQRSAVQKPVLTTDDSAIAALFSFHNISSIHGNPRRGIMLRRQVLILVVRIAIARHATDLRREMCLLLRALAVMRLRRCIPSHRRCVLRWLLCINRSILLITHILPLVRALMYHGRCSSRAGKSTWWLRLPTVRSNLSRSEHWHLGPGHAMWTHETSLRGIVNHHRS